MKYRLCFACTCIFGQCLGEVFRDQRCREPAYLKSSISFPHTLYFFSLPFTKKSGKTDEEETGLWALHRNLSSQCSYKQRVSSAVAKPWQKIFPLLTIHRTSCIGLQITSMFQLGPYTLYNKLLNKMNIRMAQISHIPPILFPCRLLKFG